MPKHVTVSTENARLLTTRGYLVVQLEPIKVSNRHNTLPTIGLGVFLDRTDNLFKIFPVLIDSFLRPMPKVPLSKIHYVGLSEEIICIFRMNERIGPSRLSKLTNKTIIIVAHTIVRKRLQDLLAWLPRFPIIPVRESVWWQSCHLIVPTFSLNFKFGFGVQILPKGNPAAEEKHERGQFQHAS